MLDINLFREDRDGNPELIRESQRRRFQPADSVDKVIALDNIYRDIQYKLDRKNTEANEVSKAIGQLKKAKDEAGATAKLEEANRIRQEAEALKVQMKEAKDAVDNAVKCIGNLVHESAPVFQDEDDNVVVTIWGELRPKDNLQNHVDLFYMTQCADWEKAVEVAGNRAYFLVGAGVRLNLALIQFGLEFLSKRHYTEIQPPFFMRDSAMAKCAQLADFDEQLYKVTGDGDNVSYLIATSEQPLACFHMDEFVDKSSLPYRYAGYSSCFRKEVGKHGRDTLGIFRVHQFEKIEQFAYTAPDKSWEMHEELLKNAEDFLKCLELPYRVVNMVSGALNDAAAKKYDIEGWFPGSGAFRELVSCSNCTDYQARRLEVRYGVKSKDDNKKEYVHMLNSTLCATSRTLCAIFENYQTTEGIRIPKVLQAYMGGCEFIPFKRGPEVIKESKPKAK